MVFCKGTLQLNEWVCLQWNLGKPQKIGGTPRGWQLTENRGGFNCICNLKETNMCIYSKDESWKKITCLSRSCAVIDFCTFFSLQKQLRDTTPFAIVINLNSEKIRSSAHYNDCVYILHASAGLLTTITKVQTLLAPQPGNIAVQYNSSSHERWV